MLLILLSEHQNLNQSKDEHLYLRPYILAHELTTPGLLNSNQGRQPQREQVCSKPFLSWESCHKHCPCLRCCFPQGTIGKNKGESVGEGGFYAVTAFSSSLIFRVLDTRSLELKSQHPCLWKPSYPRHRVSVFYSDCLLSILSPSPKDILQRKAAFSFQLD